MKDKVFFDKHTAQYNYEQRNVDDICYIRKDALLERFDDAIAHLSDGSPTGYYESLAYKDIRELIESM